LCFTPPRNELTHSTLQAIFKSSKKACIFDICKNPFPGFSGIAVLKNLLTEKAWGRSIFGIDPSRIPSQQTKQFTICNFLNLQNKLI